MGENSCEVCLFPHSIDGKYRLYHRKKRGECHDYTTPCAGTGKGFETLTQVVYFVFVDVVLFLPKTFANVFFTTFLAITEGREHGVSNRIPPVSIPNRPPTMRYFNWAGVRENITFEDTFEDDGVVIGLDGGGDD